MTTMKRVAVAMVALFFAPGTVMAHGGHAGGHDGVFGLLHVGLGPVVLTLAAVGLVAWLAVGRRLQR